METRLLNFALVILIFLTSCYKDNSFNADELPEQTTEEKEITQALGEASDLGYVRLNFQADNSRAITEDFIDVATKPLNGYYRWGELYPAVSDNGELIGTWNTDSDMQKMDVWPDYKQTDNKYGDPCARVKGDGWRIPTREEWHYMRDNVMKITCDTRYSFCSFTDGTLAFPLNGMYTYSNGTLSKPNSGFNSIIGPYGVFWWSDHSLTNGYGCIIQKIFGSSDYAKQTTAMPVVCVRGTFLPKPTIRKTQPSGDQLYLGYPLFRHQLGNLTLAWDPIAGAASYEVLWKVIGKGDTDFKTRTPEFQEYRPTSNKTEASITASQYLHAGYWYGIEVTAISKEGKRGITAYYYARAFDDEDESTDDDPENETSVNNYEKIDFCDYSTNGYTARSYDQVKGGINFVWTNSLPTDAQDKFTHYKVKIKELNGIIAIGNDNEEGTTIVERTFNSEVNAPLSKENITPDKWYKVWISARDVNNNDLAQRVIYVFIKADDSNITVSGLPNGLNYYSSNGLIKGTPSAANGSYTVSVSDNGQVVGTYNCNVSSRTVTFGSNSRSLTRSNNNYRLDTEFMLSNGKQPQLDEWPYYKIESVANNAIGKFTVKASIPPKSKCYLMIVPEERARQIDPASKYFWEIITLDMKLKDLNNTNYICTGAILDNQNNSGRKVFEKTLNVNYIGRYYVVLCDEYSFVYNVNDPKPFLQVRGKRYEDPDKKIPAQKTAYSRFPGTIMTSEVCWNKANQDHYWNNKRAIDAIKFLVSFVPVPSVNKVVDYMVGLDYGSLWDVFTPQNASWASVAYKPIDWMGFHYEFIRETNYTYRRELVVSVYDNKGKRPAVSTRNYPCGTFSFTDGQDYFLIGRNVNGGFKNGTFTRFWYD